MKKDSVSGSMELIAIPDDGNKPVLRLIAGAQKIIRIKQFKLTDSGMIKALIDARGRGVEVRAMLNPKADFGGRFNDATFAAFQEAGIDVRWTSALFAVSHEKSIVVDDEKALVASFNLCGVSLGATRDYGVIISDAAQVAEIAACFEADWEGVVFHPKPDSDLVWSPNNSRLMMAHFIDMAQTTLDIQNPKWVDAVILDRVLAAQNRGVHVRILCGGKHGIHYYHLQDCFSSWRILHRNGVKVRRQKYITLHAKMMVVDGKIALVGSCNVDRSAFDLRRELGIIVKEKAIVHRLAELYQRDWSLSETYLAPDPLCSQEHDAGELPPDPDFGHE